MMRELAHGSPKAKALVAEHVVRTIEERLASLAVERRLLLVTRNSSHEDVRAAEAVIAALERRRSELRATGGERLCIASDPGRL